MENKPTGRGRGSTGANRAGHGGSGRCWAGAQRAGSGRGPSGANPTGSGRGSSGAYRGDSSGRLGAIPKTSASSSQPTWRERPSSSTHNHNQPFRVTSRGRGFGLNLSQHQRQPRQANHRRLDFQYLVKLASENVEPSVVIRCLGDPENDLAQHLKENLGNFDYLELVIVALGGFCKKNGTSQFSESFVSVVRILEAQNIFQHISSIIINIPVSRVANLPVAKEERLKRFTTAVFHLATEMLVMMPAFSCQCLGQHFFTDIIALQALPSIKALNVADAFNVFEAGITTLQTAWSQHIPVEIKKDDRRLRMEEYSNDAALQDPPDNFRTLNVMPNWEDVCLDVEPFLRPSIVKGEYPDVTTYLDIQFRILREDFFNPLRVGLLAYKNQDRKFSKKRPDNIRLYHGVRILDYDMHGDYYTIQFSDAHLKKINWETSKRFMFGSLLCLSADNFASFHLFTVADRNPILLSHGKIKVKFEGGTLSAALKQQIFVMAESTVFFESYRTILTALQRISPTNFPLEDYILGRKTSPEMPDYLLEKENPVYDLSFTSDLPSEDDKDEEKIINKISNFLDTAGEAEKRKRFRIQRAQIFEPRRRPNAKDLELDPSQCNALYAALTQKISVIQGPPGTGKTYLGLRIVQALLKNKRFWMGNSQSSPILVICYTNHALDQFLEGISKFTRQIVRVGSQSKCAALESFSLMAWKKRSSGFGGVQQDTRRWIFEIHDTLRECERKREVIRGAMVDMSSSGLIHEDSLLNMRIIPQFMHNKFEILMKLFRYGADGWTALGIWLQIYWNDALEQEVISLERNRTSKIHQTVRCSNVTTDTLVEEKADDEWDKDHIEEMQAFRKVEEEDYLTPLKEQRSITRNIELEIQNDDNRYVEFCYRFSETETTITKFQESLETFEGEDAEVMGLQIRELQNQVFFLRQLLQGVPTLDENQLNELYQYDLLQIPLLQRWMMYNSWKVKALEIQEERAAQLEKLYFENAKKLKDVRNLESAEICQKADIVGLTTTGAAKQRALLNHLKPKIVVVEEAAEVLESHVVCALSTSCQQLVLIGDHQQLRPPVTVYKLAKDYFLDVSLFERLIKNGMEPCVLGVQHRMRPEIARLIVPSIYPTLENHSSVLEYPDVRGMASNVFFLAHTEQEVEDNEGKSHLNPYEVDLSLALARHLIMQGYTPEQITILTTYSGQLLHFFKVRRSHSAVQSVRISVVDNFQGEENDIIILSLVRSNVDENIGFLRIENRICVALSRAKHGFYMIGNMQNLQGKSRLWNGISRILDNDGQIGPDFGLRCDVHGVVTQAHKVTDFPPEGGCMNKCSSKMPCGHICPKMCHADDRDHALVKCQELCTRFCPVGHPCPKKCFAVCNPCVKRVNKTLPCTHEQIVLCYKNPARVFCQTSLWKILPECGHGMDLPCGASVSEAVCPEMCGMTLDCGHICPLPCHKKIPHDKIRCQQPCQRLCSDEHGCKKKCFEDCGNCLTKMKKLLPCGHEGEVECSQDLTKVDCAVKVIKVLTNCEHSVEIECGKTTDGYKCKKPCEKLLCTDGHICKKPCFVPCGNCTVRMSRELKCGHTTTVECYVDPSNVRCRVPKECVLPLCGHYATIHCGQEPTEANCPLPCDVRLECGHTCTLKCHVKKDPDHQDYQCKKECGRMKQGCKKEHRCGKKCFEECVLCTEKWQRSLPCGHTIFTECHRNDEEIFCSKLMTKMIPECGHEVDLPCSTEPTRALCKKMCASELPCGHLCKKKCCEPCNQADCVEPLTTIKVNLCGHHVTLSCKDFHEVGGVPTEKQIQSHLTTCLKPCKATLDCEHLCKGTCGECFNGRVHRACDEKCGRSLVCGHICNVNCGISCPPCGLKCQYSCSHSKCGHKCCEPCTPCKEKCPWSCQHKTCTKKCGDPCNRSRCDEPCKKTLPCGHFCAGLCGEICPPLCRVCDKEKLTEFIMLGNEDEEDAKFVFLPDCGHCIEVEAMDKWMDTDGGGQIQQKCCPRCKTPIKVCMRYGDIIKNVYGDIAKAKMKIFQSKGNPLEFSNHCSAKLTRCRNIVRKCEELVNSTLGAINKNLDAIEQQVKPKKNGKGKIVHPPLGSDVRFQIEVNLDVLERVLEMLEKMTTPKTSLTSRSRLLTPPPPPAQKMTPELMNEFFNLVRKLIRSVVERVRISTREYQAASRELDRFEYVRAYFVLQSTPSFPVLGASSPENELIQRLLMKNIRVLENEQKVELRAAMETLGVKLKTGLGITDKERREIVQALGMGQGHWFKCPNGHIYAIGDCGGASVESRCNECQARIGGTGHRLLGDNRLAGEMDGAARPAWPQ